MARRRGVEFEDIEGFVAIPNWSQIPRDKRQEVYRFLGDGEPAFIDRVREGERMVFIREDLVERYGLRGLIVNG